MAFKISKPTAAIKSETVDLGELGSFKVLIRPPTWNEKLVDEGLAAEAYGDSANAGLIRASAIEHRLRSTISGWEELNGEDGKPLPFSWDAVKSICNQYKTIFYEFYGFANEAFRGLDESAEKNSESPSNAGSEGQTTAATTSETGPSSQPGVGSENQAA